MKLKICHRNVKMNLVFASLIAQKLYQLEATLGVAKASVTVERDPASCPEMRIFVQLDTNGSRISAEGLDKEPRTALLRLMRSLQKQVRPLVNSPRLGFSASASRNPVVRR